MKIFVLNGPNLNMLGKREQQHYGISTLAEIETNVRKAFPNVSFEFFQSNLEGEIVKTIHKVINGDFDALISNFGAYTHTSVAIRDALCMLTLPKIEVHLSNIHARENFRKKTLTGEVSDGIISGFGATSYVLGVYAAMALAE